MTNKEQKAREEYWRKYWLGVKSCVAYSSGHTEIHHKNGQIEYFNPKGKRIEEK